ncbi:MAG: hypothetical protein ACLGH0_08245 [Thermoanaerobaculia bacterium]
MLALVLALLATFAVATLVLADGKFTYIFKRNGQTYMRMNATSIAEIELNAKRIADRTIWVNRGGKQYLIRDAAVIAEAQNAFRELDKLEPAMREIEERMRPFEAEMDRFEEELDELTDSYDEDAEERVRDLEDKIRDAEVKVREAEKKVRVVEREMEELERKMEKLEVVAEAKFEKIVEEAIDKGLAERVD